MSQLLDSVESMKPLNRGDVVEGVVMRSDPDGILLNIGHKAEGVVPPGEMRTLGPQAARELNIGDQIVATVVKSESAEGAVILSIDRAVGEQGWRLLENALESNSSMEGEVLDFNRGGAIVQVHGLQAFVPMSQLLTVSPDKTQKPESEDSVDSIAASDEQDSESAQAEKNPDIGRVIELKVIEVNRDRNRAILSERLALQEQRNKRKADLIGELSVGEVRKGTVTGMSHFGAFVDLGGADGLIHISEMSWNTIRSPEEVVTVGQEIDIYVLRVDEENNKIGLSLKRLQQEPWETVDDLYKPGDLVEATVTKVTDFGAFARIEGSVEGLIHISELTPRMINHPRDVVNEGDVLKLRVLRIESEKRRMGLSLKQVEEEEA